MTYINIDIKAGEQNYLKNTHKQKVCCFIEKKNQKALMVSIGNVIVVRKIARIL